MQTSDTPVTPTVPVLLTLGEVAYIIDKVSVQSGLNGVAPTPHAEMQRLLGAKMMGAYLELEADALTKAAQALVTRGLLLLPPLDDPAVA